MYIGVTTATLVEQSVLELRFDGPIPALAVVDLRACPPRPFAIAMLPDAALAHWQSLAMRNLKAEQQRLADGRYTRCRMRVQWCLRQCVAARAEWQVFKAETARRAASTRL